MVDWNQIGTGLAGFGAGMEGRGAEFLKGLEERKQRSALADLGSQFAAGDIDQTQYLKQLAAQNPEMYSKMALTQMGAETPAVLKINNAIQQALANGDVDTANRIAWLARSQAYGVNTFGGGAPNTAPQTPPPGVPPVTSPVAPVTQPPISDAPQGSDIASQLAANAALKKGAETQAQKNVELEMNPQIEFKTAAAKAAADLEGDKKKEYEANKKVSPVIAELYALNETSPEGTYAGKAQWIRRLAPGVSPEEKSIDLMQQARLEMAAPLAKQLGVNPTDKDFQASLDTIFDMDASRESRAAQIKRLADKIERQQKQLGEAAPPRKMSEAEKAAGDGQYSSSLNLSDPRVRKALDAGYTPDEIIAHMGK